MRGALLASCDAAAAKAAKCVIAAGDREAAVLALVFWRGPSHIRVEVGLGSRSVPWAIRELEFSSRDPAIEKWRTVGYTVGSLAAEALEAKEHPERDQAAAVPEPGAPPEPQGSAEHPGAAGNEKGGGDNGAGDSEQERNNPAGAAAPAAPAKPLDARTPGVEASAAPGARDTGTQPPTAGLEARRWTIAAAALVGPGLGPVRLGGSLRASRAFHGPYATAAGAYSVDVTDTRNVSSQRFALSAGGGYEWSPGRGFAIAVRGEVMAEFLAAHVDEPLSGRSDGRSRWTPALNAGVEAAQSVTGPVAVFVGMDVTVRTNRTDIHVGNVNVASVPMTDVAGLVGARFALR